jgi:ribose/xylose/arabinose/galactoside ABC-type transport system permease subunit
MSSLLFDTTSLLAAGVPQPTRDAPGELTDKVNTVLGIAAWAGTAAGVAGVLITGAMMAISVKRGESSEHMSRLGMVLGGCVLVATAGPLVNFVFA